MLAGRQDQLVDVHCSQTLADKCQVHLRIHEKAGHDLPLDDAQWVITAIQEWRRDVFSDKNLTSRKRLCLVSHQYCADRQYRQQRYQDQQNGRHRIGPFHQVL